jgi:hypothetical protein
MALMRSDTYSVSVEVPRLFAWKHMADVGAWRNFSPFVLAAEQIGDDLWRVTSPQGLTLLRTNFSEDLCLLDHTVYLEAGPVLIPYRVVPNLSGCELIMTNFQSPGDSDAEYAEQVDWMRRELDGAREYLRGLFEASR